MAFHAINENNISNLFNILIVKGDKNKVIVNLFECFLPVYEIHKVGRNLK